MKREFKLEIFLKKSNLRRKVWGGLDNVKTAGEIAKELGKHRSAVSRVLLNMQKADLIKCVNPEDKSFRHYVKR